MCVLLRFLYHRQIDLFGSKNTNIKSETNNFWSLSGRNKALPLHFNKKATFTVNSNRLTKKSVFYSLTTLKSSIKFFVLNKKENIATVITFHYN